jgi:hypothetical protein
MPTVRGDKVLRKRISSLSMAIINPPGPQR